MDAFLHRPILVDPPMCSLKELQDGTYSIEDVMTMHEIMDLKMEINKSKG